MSPEKEEPETDGPQTDEVEPLPTMLPHRGSGARQETEKAVEPNLGEEILAHLADELRKEIEENSSESDDQS